MAGRIHVLPEEIARTIAAGEVVERPGSVVKELMENAIDAGSTAIVVEVEAGGLQLIRVQDDGEGIEEEDVPLALQRYATSKIRKSEDLFALHTLGFRGEALPSIASVSQLTLTTRVARSLSGIKAVCEGGEVKSLREAGCPKGTAIEVRQLFYNVPVKRKFMKSIRSELQQIVNHFLRLSLAYPGISFKLVHDGRLLYDLVKTDSPLVRIEALLGREAYRHLRPVEWEDEGITLSGFASLPAMVKGKAEGIYIYVNGRTVKDRIIHKAVMDAYRRVIPEGKFPMVVLFITLPPSEVDVNVHPTKAEVKFRDPEHLFRAVSGALRSFQEPTAPVVGRPSGGEVQEAPQTEPMPFRAASTPSYSFNDPRIHQEGAGASVVRESGQPEWRAERQVPIRILGQVQGTFLVCEGEQGLVLIDQHAAHERILFDKFRKEHEARSVSSTSLLLPLLLDVNAEESFILSSSLETFLSIGFEIDPAGEKTFAVRTVPSGLDERTALEMIKEIMSELALVKREGRATETMDTLLVTLACHSAIRANHPLRREEMEGLVRELASFYPHATCPHGRPIFLFLGWDELNRQFKRTH